MIVYFCDRKMNILGHAATQLRKSIRIAEDHKIVDVDTGSTTLEFDIVYNKSNKAKCREMAQSGNYLLVNENDGWLPETKDRFGWYTIITTEDNSADGARNVYAEGNGLDLLNMDCEPYENTEEKTIAQYLTPILADSGFSINLNSVQDKLALTFDTAQTAKERIQEIADAFDAEVWFSFDVKNFKVLNKYINITKKRGKSSGPQLRLNREVANIIEKESVEQVATAINVEGGTPTGSMGVKSRKTSTGKQLYTWIKYADSPTEGMSDSYVDKMYIGIAVDKADQKESDNYGDYKWVQFCSKDASGRKNYSGIQVQVSTNNWVWVRYARKNTGDDFNVSPVGRKYIGLAYGKTSANASTDTNQYEWHRRSGDESEAVTLEGYVYDDGDFYVDGKYLKSRNALAKWSRYLTQGITTKGHITKIYTSQETDQDKLFQESLKHLQEISDKKTDYEIEIVKIKEDIAPGDVIKVSDEAGNLYLKMRAMKIDTCHANRVITVTPGDYEKQENQLSQLMKELAKKYYEEAPKPTYTWVAYADDENGKGITLEPGDKAYIGITANQSDIDPNIADPTVYRWSKFKGDKGEKGDKGADFDANKLKIGGRNLAWHTGTPYSYATNHPSGDGFSADDVYTTVNKMSFADIGLEVGDTAIVSFDWQFTGTRMGSFLVEARENSTYRQSFPGTRTTIPSSGSSGHYSMSATIADAGKNCNMICVRIDNSVGTFVISNFKLEKGTIATDWTPAPEDLEESIAAAKAAGDNAKASADSKTIVFHQDSVPTTTGRTVGDTWFDTHDSNKMYKWDGSRWTGVVFGENAIANLSANKITTGTLDAKKVSVSNLDAGSITSGTMSADRINGGKIKGQTIEGGTINGTTITGGSLTSTKTANGTTNTVKISDGAITSPNDMAIDVDGSLEMYSADIRMSSEGAVMMSAVTTDELTANIRLDQSGITLSDGGEGLYFGGISTFNNGLELYHPSTPYIDFHYANSTVDYTGRLACDRSGLYSYSTIRNLSDKRAKSQIKSLDKETAIEIIDKLLPKEYHYRKHVDTEVPYYGFIAQEVEATLDEVGIDGKKPIVNGGEDRLASIDYAQIAPLLVSYVQDLKKEIHVLKGETVDLRKETEKLKDEMKKQQAQIDKILEKIECLSS